jgi:hypothetical protein
MNRAPWINVWTMLGAVAVAGCLLMTALISMGGLRARPAATAGFVAADLTIIPLPSPGAQPSTPTVDPRLLGSATPPPGQIAVNAYVQITGTGGDGLRIRSAAGLNSDTVFTGGESETFVVKDGPQQADGYTWWYLVAPYDSTRAGWAAADFLAVVPPPSPAP